MPSDPIDITSMTDKYAVTTWTSNEFDFTAPSGQVCRLRKLDPLSLIEEGILGQLDFVTSVVMNEHIPNAQMSTAQRIKAEREKSNKTDEQIAEEVSDASYKAMMEDPKKIGKLRDVVDRVACQAVAIPKVHPLPKGTEEDPRVDGLIYTDMISFGDKMAIFNAVMKGVKMLEQFREGSGEPVGPVASQPSVSRPAKRRTGVAKK